MEDLESQVNQIDIDKLRQVTLPEGIEEGIDNSRFINELQTNNYHKLIPLMLCLSEPGRLNPKNSMIAISDGDRRQIPEERIHTEADVFNVLAEGAKRNHYPQPDFYMRLDFNRLQGYDIAHDGVTLDPGFTSGIVALAMFSNYIWKNQTTFNPFDKGDIPALLAIKSRSPRRILDFSKSDDEIRQDILKYASNDEIRPLAIKYCRFMRRFAYASREDRISELTAPTLHDDDYMHFTFSFANGNRADISYAPSQLVFVEADFGSSQSDKARLTFDGQPLDAQDPYPGKDYSDDNFRWLSEMASQFELVNIEFNQFFRSGIYYPEIRATFKGDDGHNKRISYVFHGESSVQSIKHMDQREGKVGDTLYLVKQGEKLWCP